MKLKKISITNFRSITEAHEITLSNFSVIIWKNNEWKSNILKALNISMNTLQRNGRFWRFPRDWDENNYSRERDFPISSQTHRGKKETIFKLEFELTNEEIDDISNNLKSILNWKLPIQITFKKDGIHPDIKINKKWNKALEKKKTQIIDYISNQISFTYIPAIRTEEHTMNIINNMISWELWLIEEKEEYQSAIQKIKDLQKPIFKKISNTIKESVIQLLPWIKSVDAFIPDNEMRLWFRSRPELWLDDWSKTRIEFKWDWVKSLVALSLLKDAKTNHKFSLIAIEEPESHLHPWAIHNLRDAIYELSENNQIIISTHNPLFVNREQISSNIIIDNWKATLAKKINTIRDILGIRQSDNLVNANYVLVVEWNDDIISLKAILSHESEKIKKAIIENTFVIESLLWASNLSYKLSTLRNSLCSYYVFLDHDSAWKDAYNTAEQSWYLTIKDISFATCNWMIESELEDCLDPNYYKDIILDKFWVNINVSEMRWNQKRSNRMKNVFLSQGKVRTDRIKEQVKLSVANEVTKDPWNALNQHKRSSIDSLKLSIEAVIK